MVALTALLAALTAVGAYLHVPMPLVPFTLQTLFVYLTGLLLPPAFAFLCQCSYLMAGLAGLPVFAGARGGLSVVQSPTFGYLLAFPVASSLVSYLSRRQWAREFVAGAIGALTILLVGSGYLWFATRVFIGVPLPIRTALSAGALVFLPVEAAKVMVAGWIARRLRVVIPQE